MPDPVIDFPVKSSGDTELTRLDFTGTNLLEFKECLSGFSLLKASAESH